MDEYHGEIYDSAVGPVIDVAPRVVWKGVLLSIRWLIAASIPWGLLGYVVYGTIEKLQWRGGNWVRELAGVFLCLGAIALPPGYFFFAVAARRFRAAFQSDCFLRAGPGGVSIRVPGDVTWSSALLNYRMQQLDIPWAEIRTWHTLFEYSNVLIWTRSLVIELKSGVVLRIPVFYFAGSLKRISANMLAAQRRTLERKGLTNG